MIPPKDRLVMYSITIQSKNDLDKVFARPYWFEDEEYTDSKGNKKVKKKEVQGLDSNIGLASSLSSSVVLRKGIPYHDKFQIGRINIPKKGDYIKMRPFFDALGYSTPALQAIPFGISGETIYVGSDFIEHKTLPLIKVYGFESRKPDAAEYEFVVNKTTKWDCWITIFDKGKPIDPIRATATVVEKGDDITCTVEVEVRKGKKTKLDFKMTRDDLEDRVAVMDFKEEALNAKFELEEKKKDS